MSDLFADATMSTSAEWLIWTLRSLAYRTKTVIDLLAVLVRVHPECLGSSTLRVIPPEGVKGHGIFPDTWVNLGYSRRRHNEVALGNDISAIFGRSREGWWDGHIRHNFAHDRMDRRMKSESLADNRVKNGKVLEFFISEVTELALFAGAKKFDLFTVKGFTVIDCQFAERNTRLEISLTQFPGCRRYEAKSTSLLQNLYVDRP